MLQTQTSVVDLAVIVPTLNEVENIRPLLERLNRTLGGIAWEAIFVDDNSSDGTADLIRSIGRGNLRVRVLQRVGRRGLSSAVIEGMLATSAPTLAVIDADLQHDETILPKLYDAVAEGCDLAVGSRYVDGGSVGAWDEKRHAISRLATRLAGTVIKTPLSDPMSGFFVVSRPAFTHALPRLSGLGFKILVDLVASSPPLRIREIPYGFRNRLNGDSKLDNLVAWEYLMLLADKLVGRFIPVRFLSFAIVGALGLIVHLLTLRLGMTIMSFAQAQALAVMTAMTFNYALNNSLTYRDKRRTGRKFYTGLLSFCAVCLVGGIANVGIGEYVYTSNKIWWLGGIAGAAVGAVWNFAASSAFTWRRS